MNRLLIPILLVLCALRGSSQEFPTAARQLVLDDLGNVYLVFDRYVEKHDSRGQLLFRTSDLNLGTISYLDATNPLLPFLYYRDQNALVILDNTLSAQGQPIDLFSWEGQVELVGGSRGDAFWLWDVTASELVRVDRNFQRMYSTGNLGILLGRPLAPVQLFERGESVYLVDPSSGVYVFDIYGKYRGLVSCAPDGHVQVIQEQIAWTSGNTLHVLSSDRITETVVTLPEGRLLDFQVWGRSAYLLYDGKWMVSDLSGQTKN